MNSNTRALFVAILAQHATEDPFSCRGPLGDALEEEGRLSAANEIRQLRLGKRSDNNYWTIYSEGISKPEHFQGFKFMHLAMSEARREIARIIFGRKKNQHEASVYIFPETDTGRDLGLDHRWFASLAVNDRPRIMDRPYWTGTRATWAIAAQAAINLLVLEKILALPALPEQTQPMLKEILEIVNRTEHPEHGHVDQ